MNEQTWWYEGKKTSCEKKYLDFFIRLFASDNSSRSSSILILRLPVGACKHSLCVLNKQLLFICFWGHFWSISLYLPSNQSLQTQSLRVKQTAAFYILSESFLKYLFMSAFQSEPASMLHRQLLFILKYLYMSAFQLGPANTVFAC